MASLKLVRVEIQGFRQFRALMALDLRDPAGAPLEQLVLAGPNGSGKTTLLEAILLGLGQDDLLLRDAPGPRDSRALMGPQAVVTVMLAEEGGPVHTLTRREDGLKGRHPLAEGGDALHNAAQLQSLLVTLPVEYLSARRLPARVGPVQDETRGRAPAPTEANRIWTFKKRLRSQQGRRVPGYRGPEPRDEAWLARLNAFWREFRDDGTTFTLTLVEPDNLDRGDWDLFLYRGEERICAVDALSSGEQEILAMAVPFITEPFDGLLLIDEPEQHLHPQWQGRILRALRRLVPGAQVIVATHADDPWDDAMSWERVLLVPPQDPRAADTRGEGR